MPQQKPTRIQLTTYQVGFGDCFLLTFYYDNNPRTRTRHVLIDFGRTHKPHHGEDEHGPSMLEIAEDIQQRVQPEGSSNGKLDVIVATHRHRDHISGFSGASGRILSELDPRLIVQPWTEDPTIPADATGAPARDRQRRRFAASLKSIDVAAHQVKNFGERLGKQRSLTDALRATAEQLEFLGFDNITNRQAVEWLNQHGAQHDYLHYGKSTRMNRILPGVKVTVLGPPTVDQYPEVSRMRSRDPQEYWHMHATTLQKAGSKRRKDSKQRLPTSYVPEEALWFIHRLDESHAREMLGIARDLDSVLNNTSLILLFECGDQSLLFPGDAQIENWSYALFHARKKAETIKRLKKVTVYKVGHHGSLNATPKTVWKGFDYTSRSSSQADRLVSVLSTMPGAHGHVSSNTEVPRRTLTSALDQETDLLSTTDLENDDLCYELEVPVTH